MPRPLHASVVDKRLWLASHLGRFLRAAFAWPLEEIAGLVSGTAINCSAWPAMLSATLFPISLPPVRLNQSVRLPGENRRCDGNRRSSQRHLTPLLPEPGKAQGNAR